MTTKNKKGFTIIEVVLVLAIAGLIFLMVFIALPALQRSQRNTQREDDLARVITGVNNFQTNNNGKVPFGYDNAKIGDFVNRYIDKNCTVEETTRSGELGKSFKCGDNSNEFRDPQGNPYWMSDGGEVKANGSASFAGASETSYGFIGYANATCGDEGKYLKGTGKRDVAVFMRLEGGAIACNDNH